MEIITKVYDRYEQARSAVSDLEAAGIPPSAISLMANRHVSDEYGEAETSAPAAGAGIGAVLGGSAGLLAALGLITIPGVGAVIAGGWLGAAALGALAGGAAGGILGALVEAGVPEEHAHVYSEAVRRGGTLVSVQADAENADRVLLILDRHQPIDPATRRTEYGASGWTAFDPLAQPYRLSESEIEQIRRTV